ncbi:DUF4412 domain-containing protein [Desulforhabdus amnigena]|jgi:hypothetical protein|uniref:DUF4412 domain-containing protein n=1 Tax=Desulforhabdus amnigena TaxID=40218 RepID=A0A9W6FV75_9BACT|nr:DUF4412 domain-containing protein [Desulforhabdus amnigena]NLJ28144.1 DUF4412 domain-containing protein [Deltaproteobacteria bacterium]GLI35464.1 hypothetical protein DAMNIGENAA_28970 [Desulforhabdus amnigena]
MKHSRKKQLFPLVLFLSVFMTSTTAFADLYWEFKQVSKGVEGQPDATRIQKNYYTDRASRVETGSGAVMIMDLDSMTIYQLDPRSKTYIKSDMRKMGAPEQMPGMSAEQRKKMIENMAGSMKVTPTDETKTIAGYNCRKYNVGFMNSSNEYWLSKDVKGYDELKRIGAKMAMSFEANPVLKQMNIAGIMDKLDGFPVQIITHAGRGTMTSTLIKIEQKPLPAELFQVPKGYKVMKRE